MATDVDLWELKKQVVSILEANTTLFDATGANDKVRVIDAGAPRMRNNLIIETTLPQIWVTNEPVIDVLEQTNSSTGTTVKVTKHTIGLRIILLSQEKTGFFVEEVLDDFVKLINEIIEISYDLRDPGGAENTSLADSCKITRVTEISPQMTGKGRQGRIISLKCVVTTG